MLNLTDWPEVSVIVPTFNRKEELCRLLDSVYASDYPLERLKVIVIDDLSEDGTSEVLSTRYPQLVLVRPEIKLRLSRSRNLGMKISKSSFFFLLDDDNVISKDCISELVQVFLSDGRVGVCGPVSYYLSEPNRIWGVGVQRNMTTSLTRWIGRDQVDNGQFKGLIELKDTANAFMLSSDVVKEIGYLNEIDFPMAYDEADFGERVRRAGYMVVCNPRAKVWHDVPSPGRTKRETRLYHVDREDRAYYAGRNRVTFLRKYSGFWRFIIFAISFNWLFAVYYVTKILKSPIQGKERIANSYIKGIISGLGSR